MKTSRKAAGDSQLAENLRSSAVVSGGFMGDDIRSYMEIVRADEATLAAAGSSAEEIADLLAHLTKRAADGQGMPVVITPTITVTMSDTRGWLGCPWGHAGVYRKNLVELAFQDGRPLLHWSELSIHLIREHHFFQGRGAPFRLDPSDLLEVKRQLIAEGISIKRKA